MRFLVYIIFCCYSAAANCCYSWDAYSNVCQCVCVCARLCVCLRACAYFLCMLRFLLCIATIAFQLANSNYSNSRFAWFFKHASFFCISRFFILFLLLFLLVRRFCFLFLFGYLLLSIHYFIYVFRIGSRMQEKEKRKE